MADRLELVRSDVGLRFCWQQETGFVDVSPTPDGHVDVYEGINVQDLNEPFTPETLAKVADAWISDNNWLLG